MFEWWNVSLATNRLISVLIRTTIRIQKFLTEFLPLEDKGSLIRIKRDQLRWRNGGGLWFLSASNYIIASACIFFFNFVAQELESAKLELLILQHFRPIAIGECLGVRHIGET